MSIQFTRFENEVTGAEALTVFIPGRGIMPPVDDTHPNYAAIKAACQDAFDDLPVDADAVADLFDVAEHVARKFERLSDRVTVKNGTLFVDGDPIHGTLQEQILQFLDAGEDFAPLVEFYEKLLTNPLGDVRAGVYDWINGQRKEGNFTITPDGDILGYKSVTTAKPEWRTDEDEVFVPSQRGEGIVNGRDVAPDQFIEQVVGDVVEMPRSRVLNAPSVACGDGLHIGTDHYAKGFTGDTVMLVKFSPRDIVSLPDSNATWKLRVCRYEVVGTVDEPLEVPVYSPQGVETPTVEYGCHGWDEPDLDVSLPSEECGLDVGDRVKDGDGDTGVIRDYGDDSDFLVQYDNPAIADIEWDEDELTRL